MPLRDEECPFAKDLPEFARGELKLDLRREMAKHVASCATCQQDLLSLRRLQSALAKNPMHGGDHLTERILASLRREGFARAWLSAHAGFIVSGIALGALVVCTIAGPSLHRPLLEHAQDRSTWTAANIINGGAWWLVANQEEDGSWSAKRSGGQESFDVGVSGLAIQALLTTSSKSPAARKAIEKGVMWLVSQQSQDGGFGTRLSGSLYNDGPATVALGLALKHFKASALEAPFSRAIRHLMDLQCVSGGWGSGEFSRGRASTLLSFWPFEALTLAQSLGRQDVRESIERAKRFLDHSSEDATVDESNHPWAASARLQAQTEVSNTLSGATQSGTHAISPAPATWLARYVASCASSNSQSSGNDEFPVECTREGPWLGSVNPEKDPFGREGGRVYVTSLAMLSVAKSQHDRLGEQFSSKK